MKEENRKMKHRKTLKEDFTTDYTTAFLPTVTATADNANSVEEYFGTLMQSVVETWGLHLNTNKYSEHIALNDFYDEMIDLVDTLIENYKGIYGNIPTKPNVFKPEASSAAEYLREFRAFVENGKSLFTDSELLSDIDSILSAIDECLYKVENLTENRKRNRKIEKTETVEESKRLPNKRLSERKVKNTDKLNKLNSLIKEGYEEIDYSEESVNDSEPYWMSIPELKLMADKLIRRFGNERNFEDFYNKAFEYANGYISEDALSAFAVCDIDEMDDDEKYYKTIDDFIATVWEVKDEGYLTESVKRINKKVMKESKELRLIDSFEVMAPDFSEIGYFGRGNWYNAMDFSENNSEGWRLPTAKEGEKLIAKYYKELSKMIDPDYFWIWTNEKIQEDECRSPIAVCSIDELSSCHIDERRGLCIVCIR